MTRIRIDIVPAPMPLYIDEGGTAHEQLTPSTLPCHLRLVGGNGEILMNSEDYSNRSNARRAAKRLATDLGITRVRELPVTDYVEII